MEQLLFWYDKRFPSGPFATQMCRDRPHPFDVARVSYCIMGDGTLPILSLGRP